MTECCVIPRIDRARGPHQRPVRDLPATAHGQQGAPRRVCGPVAAGR